MKIPLFTLLFLFFCLKILLSTETSTEVINGVKGDGVKSENHDQRQQQQRPSTENRGIGGQIAQDDSEWMEKPSVGRRLF